MAKPDPHVHRPPLPRVERPLVPAFPRKWMGRMLGFVLGLCVVLGLGVWNHAGAVSYGITQRITGRSPAPADLALLNLGMNQKFAIYKCLTVGAWHCHAPTKIIPRISNAADSLFISEFYVVRLWTPAVKVAEELNSAGIDRQFQEQLSQAQTAYESGQLDEAATVLDSILRSAQSQEYFIVRAIALSNLALVRGQQGQWTPANQLIVESVALLRSPRLSSASSVEPETIRFVLAQTLNIQGRMELAQRNPEAAYHTWGIAAQEFQSIGHRAGEVRSLIRQARALQSQGYHQRAVTDIFLPLEEDLRRDANSLTKVQNLLSLGDALQSFNRLDDAQRLSEQSLQVARQLGDAGAIAASYLALGNATYAQAKAKPSVTEREALYRTSLDYYRQAMEPSDTAPQIHDRAALNTLSLLVDRAENQPQAEQAVDFWRSHLQSRASHFPNTRDGIYARLNLAEHLLCLKQPESCDKSFPPASSIQLADIEALLITAQHQATALGDIRAHAYALGYWGAFYQHTQNIRQAQVTTEQALVLAKSVNATDMTYRWYEQLGELLENQGESERAIAAYTGAVDTLKTLRTDLTTLNPEGQFSFSDSIDPIHRKLVNLLLSPAPGQMSGSVPDDPAILEEARKVIESLQLEELNNFLQAACLDVQDDVTLDQIADEQTVAIIYPIILPDRAEIIVRFPQQPLRRYTSSISEPDLTALTNRLRETIGSKFYSIGLDFLEPATQMYDVLIRPMEADLTAAQPETLVFVLDGGLRNIPMSALFDGNGYLIERYAIAIAPSLQLVDPRPLQGQRLEALTFGLTQSRQGFPELPNVESEINAIGDTIASTIWLDEAFTEAEFNRTVSRDADPIVHLATHGQFSSQLDETFILSWDDKISVNELNRLIRDRDRPIELLVLSACETAAGDQRAALGLAGMAVRAGARSTLASLWKVDDAGTSEVMKRFYTELTATPGISKAKALQETQKYILSDRIEFEHPYYWAPFILVGNWL